MNEELIARAMAQSLPPAILKQAIHSYEEDKFDECIGYCEAIIANKDASDKVRATAMYLLGDVYLDLERFEQADALFDSLVALDKSDVAFANRGFSLFCQRKWPAALENYFEATRLNPKNWVAVGFTAECLVQLGQPERAIKLLVEAAGNGADHPKVFRILGASYSKQEKWIDAYGAFYKALSMDPDDEFSKNAIEAIERLANDES